MIWNVKEIRNLIVEICVRIKFADVLVDNSIRLCLEIREIMVPAISQKKRQLTLGVN